MENNIEELKKQRNRSRIFNIILIIIIIILLLLGYIVGSRIGKIGLKSRETTTQPEEITQEEKLMPEIEITQDDIDVTKETQLNIFNNEKFNGQKIIAPHSKGTYQFYIKNISKSDVKYDIKFTDEMKHFVNMKYKLKMDNIYIKGNADNYVTLDELNLNDIVVLKDSINIFTLEWYWEDDDELDTYVGGKPEEDRYYKLNLEINSEEYKK